MKKLKKVLLIVFLVFNSASYSQDNFNSGYNEYMYGDLNKAVKILSSCIERKEELSKSYMYRGAAQMFLNEFSKSESDLNSSLKMDSKNEKIYFYFGKLYTLKKEYTKAIENYRIAISKKPDYAEAYNEMASVKGLQGNYIDALQDSNLAIAIDSTNQLFYSNRGFTKIKLGKIEESITDFDLSLKIKPNKKAFSNRGLAYLYLKNYLLAIENFSEALNFESNDPEVLYYRGSCYETIGKIEEACKDYTKSVSIINNKSSSEGLIRLKCTK